MFSFGSGSSSTAGKYDPRQERDPPPLPTRVILPNYVPSLQTSSNWGNDDVEEIVARFARLRKGIDVGPEHVDAFNISYHSEVKIEDLIPAPPEDRAYIPDQSWFSSEVVPVALAGAPPQTSKPLLSTGRPIPVMRDFQVRFKELQFENQHAFTALTRLAPEDKKPPRLIQLRRFWEGLDNMAYYWDTSLDEYTPLDETAMMEDAATSVSTALIGDPMKPIQDNEPRKKPKIHAQPGPSYSSIHPAFDSFIASRIRALPHRTPPLSRSGSQELTGRYKGNRIGNGVGMPEQFRFETVKAFMEAACWAFGVTFTQHRRQPMLTIKGLRLPVRVSTAGWRAPNDRLRARAGGVEGPVIGLQCRPETDFGVKVDRDRAACIDAMRELGGLLYLAQERFRAGKKEQRSGQGKWWTTVHRWGGGPGGEVGEARGDSDSPPPPTSKEPEKDEKVLKPRNAPKREKRPSPAEVWKQVKVGGATWDPKATYEAIGKEPQSHWDEVYMVSSVIHHMRILKLRVHDAYMEMLRTGIPPTDTPEDPDWNTPSLYKTKWYDLFSKEDRAEAMVTLWSITAYLMREQK